MNHPMAAAKDKFVSFEGNMGNLLKTHMPRPIQALPIPNPIDDDIEIFLYFGKIMGDKMFKAPQIMLTKTNNRDAVSPR